METDAARKKTSENCLVSDLPRHLAQSGSGGGQYRGVAGAATCVPVTSTPNPGGTATETWRAPTTTGAEKQFLRLLAQAAFTLLARPAWVQ